MKNMLNIRSRIFLLTSLAFLSIAIALLSHYSDIQKKSQRAENTLVASQHIQALSNVIHSLQKERGRTAGYLDLFKETQHVSLSKQRQQTNFQLIELQNTQGISQRKATKKLMGKLAIMRQTIDLNKTNWPKVRTFYNHAIQHLLTLIVINTADMNYSRDILYELEAIYFLAVTRENLGQIRASINRGYQLAGLSDNELAQLSYNKGAFINALALFDVISKVHFERTNDPNWLKRTRTKEFYAIIKKIDRIISKDPGSFSDPAENWWLQVTFVLDNFKNIEDEIIAQIKRHMQQQTENDKAYLYWSAFLFISLIILVVIVSVSTIYRILKAFSIVIHSLEFVEKGQRFDHRIQADAEDEFGQIYHSINKLLSITDKVITDKEYLATTDPLTNLSNRRSLIETFNKEDSRCTRSGAPLCLIYCDIDFFKAINDQHGHAIGDDVLIALANLIKANTRANDFVARWGGEEFVILCSETNLHAALTLSEKLRKLFSQHSVHPVKNITASFGVAQKQVDETFEQLCLRADKALYQAKDGGRNKVCHSE